MKGGEKTFHHCRNFPYNFPTLPRVLTLQMCAKGQGRRERERAPITCLSQDDSSGCGKALHPSGHLLSHSPIPSQPAIFPSEGKIAQLAEAITERRGAAAGNPFSLSSPPRSTFLGRRSSQSLFLPLPRLGRCSAVPEMDGTMRRVLCTRAPVWCSTFDDSSSISYLFPIRFRIPFI